MQAPARTGRVKVLNTTEVSRVRALCAAVTLRSYACTVTSTLVHAGLYASFQICVRTRLAVQLVITSLLSCRSNLSSKSSSMFGDILGQRYLTVASRRYGSKVVVAVSVVSFVQLSQSPLVEGTFLCLFEL